MGCNVSRLDSHGTAFSARLRPLLLQRFEEIKGRRHSGHSLKDPTPSKKELLDKNIEEENNAFQHLLSPNPSKMIKVYSLEDSIKKPELSPKGKDNEEIIGVVKTNGNNNDHDVKKNMKDGDLGKNETKGSPVEDDHHVKAKIEDSFTDVDEDEEEDDDDDDDDNERMIGHEDDEAFPGSPSFRVYFKDNEEDSHIDIGRNNDALKKTVSSDDGVPLKEESIISSSSSTTTTCVEKKVKKIKGKKRRSSLRKVLLPKNLLSVKSCYTWSHSTTSHDNTHLDLLTRTGKATSIHLIAD